MPAPRIPKEQRLSEEDKSFIENNYKILSVSAIASKLKKQRAAIDGYLRDYLKDSLDVDVVALQNKLRSKPEWDQIQKEFVEDELEYFEYAYAKLVNQFKGDVLPTEETQIFNLIRVEILMNRNLKDRRRAIEDIERLTKIQDEIYDMGTDISKDQQNMLNGIVDKVKNARLAAENKTAEYLKFLDKHNALVDKLKASREQRINIVEGSKESFINLLKKLQDEEYRSRQGRQAQLMKMAMGKEQDKLMDHHQYRDGQFDKPLLTAD
jgi:membrane-associated HD superfamily phosphohydrolase